MGQVAQEEDEYEEEDEEESPAPAVTSSQDDDYEEEEEPEPVHKTKKAKKAAAKKLSAKKHAVKGHSHSHKSKRSKKSAKKHAKSHAEHTAKKKASRRQPVEEDSVVKEQPEVSEEAPHDDYDEFEESNDDLDFGFSEDKPEHESAQTSGLFNRMMGRPDTAFSPPPIVGQSSAK